MRTAEQLSPYRVQAYSASYASENKIHDDAVARRFGFAGALVPGADVYAYMTHLPVERWGRAWLERGSAECRFMRPVYDGQTAVITAVEDGDRLAIEVASDGAVCAAGSASLDNTGEEPGELEGTEGPPPPATRPPADETTLAPGSVFGVTPFRPTADFMAGYLRDVRETSDLYAREGLVHPGIMLRLCNWALTHNVVLGPWIHASSKVRHVAVARVDDTLGVHARVEANYERKGHRFVDLDVVILARDRGPVARVAHTAIWRPRQVAPE
jgi:acyl dehydratase